jgi:transcriptional regulator with XRE-family HTH domain
MVEYKKPRDAGSLALKDLRERMKLTQAQFAVQVLDTAVTTIARYETSHRPPGEVLLRLRSIARDRGYQDLAARMEHIWLEDVKRALGPEIMTYVMEGDSVLLVAALSGKRAPLTAETIIGILQQLKSDDENIRSNAELAIDNLVKAERKFDSPGSKDLNDAYRSLLSRASATFTFHGSPDAHAELGTPKRRAPVKEKKP